MKESPVAGSYKNIWHGIGRKRIEIPKSVLKSKVLSNQILQQLYIASLGYYPQAAGHYTYRKKGFLKILFFIALTDTDGIKSKKQLTR